MWSVIAVLSALAEVAAPSVSGDTLLAGLVGTLGGGGFSVWYGYHVTTKVIPKIIEDHRAERQEHREERREFQETIKELTLAIQGLNCRQAAGGHAV